MSVIPLRKKASLMSVAGVAAAMAVTSCSSVSVDHADGRSPKLIPQTFFDGKICADGVVRDRSGEEMRSFNARIMASWDEKGVGTLDEVFYFYDEPGASAKEETRVWTLTPTIQDGREVLSAKASDVPEATIMEWAGNAIHMAYTLRYGEPGDTIDLNMDDWMFHVADGVVINETRMTKFGLHVGQILLVMRKVDEDTSCL